jgi:ATP-binding cassette, subfamily B, bacterial
MVIKRLLFSYQSVWKASKSLLILIFVIKVTLGFIPLLNIWLFEELFDSIAIALDTKSFNKTVMPSLLGLALANFFTFAMQRISELLRKVLSYKFDVYTKSEIFLRSRNIPYIEFENPTFQNQYSRVFVGQRNVLTVVESSTTVVQSFVSLFSVLFYLVKIDALFWLLLLIMVVPLYILEMKNGKQRFNLMKKLTEVGRMNAYLENLLIKRELLKEIRINNLEGYFIDKWRGNFLSSSKEKISLEIKQTKWLLLSNIILFVSFLSSGGYVFWLMLTGALSIGVLAAVLQAIQNLQGIIPNLTNNMSNLYEGLLHVNEYQEFLPESEYHHTEKIELKSVGSIEARNLTFSYPNNSVKALKNINLFLEKGKTVAIIGENGSGKTTLIKCLTGLYDTEDMITINDHHSLNNIKKQEYWRNISVLFQDYNKYELSVSENIYASNVEEKDNVNKIRYYAKRTSIDGYIQSLNNKYDSILGRLFSNSNEMSGGQWQKLALTRALFKESEFLFLDEPTASMDPESEYQIIKNLVSDISEKGVIYITHRINVAMLADEIILLGNGEVVERGSHEELIKLEEKYYEIYTKQLDYLVGKEGAVVHG